MAYKRQVSEQMAESYALKNDMAFFEVSPLCDFNVTESFAELSRVALKRNGMRRTWGTDKGIFSKTRIFIFQLYFRISKWTCYNIGTCFIIMCEAGLPYITVL